jgi:hypothetical protein
MKDKNLVLLLSFAFVVFMVLNMPVILNSNFVADDILVLYIAKADPFPVFHQWTESLQNFTDIPNKPEYFYRPLHSLLMFISVISFGYNPVLFTLFSLLVQFCIFLILLKLLFFIPNNGENKNDIYLIFLALLYLFYPSNFVNTSWISGRVDLFLTLFLLLSFYNSVFYSREGGILHLINSLCFSLAALLTKDNAVLFIFPEIALLFLTPLALTVNKKYRKILITLKIVLVIIFLLVRLIIFKIYPLVNYSEFSVFVTAGVIARSLVEFLMPFDSGVVMNLFGEYGLLAVGLYSLVSFVIIAFIAFNLKSTIHKSKMLAVLLIIPLSLFIFYYFRGGLSFRFYTSAFAFWLTCIAAFSSLPKNENSFLIKGKIITTSIILLIFIIGSYTVVYAWSKSFVESREFYNQVVTYDSNKEIVLLNYPHSYNNAYSYSDITYALGFYKNGVLEKYPGIIQGAATSVYYPTNYHNVKITCLNISDTSFILNSDSPNTYFYPVPFYNDNLRPNDTINISEDISFIPKNSVKFLPFFQKSKTNSVEIITRKNTRERIYLYFSEGRLFEAR